MDELFRESFNSMKTVAALDDFFNPSGARFDASANLREQKDKYVARLYLADRNMAKVDVRVENGVLRVVAKQEKKNEAKTSGRNGETASTYSLSQYEQLLMLPGAVDASKMKVERKENTVVVTLPKAGVAVTPSPKQ